MFYIKKRNLVYSEESCNEGYDHESCSEAGISNSMVRENKYLIRDPINGMHVVEEGSSQCWSARVDT